jgi:phosphate transport system substrate-binding protein
MKRNLVILVLGAATLVGLPSCTVQTSFSKTSATADPASSTQASTQTIIRIGGSTSTVNLLNLLERNFTSTVQDVGITQLEPGQSESILEGIRLRVVDLGAISKSALKVGKNDKDLESREIAQDLLTVATHPTVIGVKNLTTADLKGIYSGTITNWQELGGPDAKIVLLDRPDDESAKQILRKYYLGADLPNSPEAVVFRKEGELIQAVQVTPYSIGAFSLAYATMHQLPVQRLSLNGIAPKRENFEAGRYPMVRTIAIVWHKQPSEVTQRLVQYISSPAASRVMEEAGFIPVISSVQPKEQE